MAHSFSQLRTNLAKIWNRLTPYFLHFVYWFGFPCIFMFGKFKHSKPVPSMNLTLLCSFLNVGLSMPGRHPYLQMAIDYAQGVESKPDPRMMMGGPPGMMWIARLARCTALERDALNQAKNNTDSIAHLSHFQHCESQSVCVLSIFFICFSDIFAK